MRGQTFKSFIFLCFSLIFTQCNSQWADNFLRSSSHSVFAEELVANIMTETFLNTKAVSIGAKGFDKQFVEIYSSYFRNSETLVLQSEKVQDQVISTVPFCAVKSYLHLLQLF